MTYALGTSRGAHHQGAAAADRRRDRGGRHRPRLSLVATSGRRCRRSPASCGRSRSASRRASASSRRRCGRKLAERFALIGVQGIVRMAMAGFDVACWDALAIAAGVPLARLLGAEPRPIPAYNSCGLGLMATDALADEAEKLLERRLPRGQAAARLSDAGRGLAAVHAVKQRIGDGVALMVDYNQALGARRGAGARPRARRGGHLLAGGADPPRRLCRRRHAGARARSCRSRSARTSRCRRHAGRARCQGAATGDARSRAHRRRHRLAARRGARRRAQDQDVIASLFRKRARICWRRRRPAISSNTWTGPTRSVQEPLRIVDGHAVVPDRPGSGMVWDAKAVERYRVCGHVSAHSARRCHGRT